MANQDKVLGIDLGTTNSVCCIWQDGKPVFIPNALGEVLTPSVVSFDGTNIVVGEIAKNRLVSHPELSTANFKRFMGSNKTVKLGKQSFRAEELSAMVLKSLRADAKKHLGFDVEEAVISVPAYFNDLQRNATKRAASIAGLKVERVINEPSAAALAYGINQGESKTFLVLDLGGGTFDVSLIEYFEKIIEIKASNGDNFLGGEDFLSILEGIYFKKSETKKEKLKAGKMQAVYSALEKAKKELSNTQSVELPHPSISDKTIMIERDEFARGCASLLDRIRKPVEQVLRDSKTPLNEIDQVVMVGGATRMPMIKNMVGLMMGRIPAMTLDPDTLIAAGCAVQAGLRENDSLLEEHVLTDVCPFSLGIGIQNDHFPEGELVFSPIIERNSTIPTSRVETYTTTQNNQTKLNMDVFQGESRLVKNNIKIGNIELKIPKAKAGKELVDVRFSYDMSGILEIDVNVQSNNEKLSKTIVNSAQNMSDKEMQAAKSRLAGLKFHPRDTEENRLLLARAEKVYETALGSDRDKILLYIGGFENVLSTQDETKISEYKKDFAELIESYEDSKYW